MKTLRLAFVVEPATGIVLFSCEPNQLRRVVIQENQQVVVSDEFTTARPDVYYDTPSGNLKPKKRFSLNQMGARVRNIPAGSRVELEGQIVNVDDGEIHIEGAKGVTRQIVVRHPHYVPQLVPIECEGYGEDQT